MRSLRQFFQFYPKHKPTCTSLEWMQTMNDSTPHLSQTKKKGWNAGWQGHRGGMESEILKSAKDYSHTIHATKDLNDQSPVLKHMLQLRMDSHKVAKRLEGDHGYDVHPEKTVKHLEDIELLSTGRSVRMPIHHAENLSAQLLESTARLRKLRDTIARNAIDKEEELQLIRRKVQDAEKNGMNRFMGVRGESKLNKRLNKTKKKYSKIDNKCEEAEFMSQKLDRMKYHLNKSLMRLHVSQGMFERELNHISKSETHARRKRLELYQSLARERRNLDLIASKVNKIRNVQKIKLNEVTKCAEDQEYKFKAEQEKTQKRERRLTMQLQQAKAKSLGKQALHGFKLNSKKNVIDIQLRPLEDVFYKVRVRTGMSNLSADAIAELYIGQSDSMTLLRNEAENAMLHLDELKDKLEERKDSLRRLENAAKETSAHKSFYAELDVVEKQLHDHVHKKERSAEIARKAKLNVTCVANFIKKMSRELRLLNLDRYVVEAPINVRSVDGSIKEGKFTMAFLEVHRVVSILSKHVEGMTEDTIVLSSSNPETITMNNNNYNPNNNNNNNNNNTTEGEEESNSRRNSRRNSRTTTKTNKNKRGVTEPIMTMDTSPMSSPMRSHKGSVAQARQQAASSLRLPPNHPSRQQSTGNIRVSVRIAKEENGYDSDLEDVKSNINGSNGNGSNAWETPRDGISLRGGGGNGGGIRGGRKTHNNPGHSKTPSVAGSDSSRSSRQQSRIPISTLFGEDEEQQTIKTNQQDEEEDRSCRTVRQQMKQVTNMVLYRAKRLDQKQTPGGGKSKTMKLPKSPRRRSIMVDNDEDDFSRLIQSVGAGSALGLSNSGSIGMNDMKPKKPKGKRMSRMNGRKKRKSTIRSGQKKKKRGDKGQSPSISNSTEF